MSVFKQRLHDNFMQKVHFFYKSAAQFQFQTYLEQINVFKYMQVLSKLRMSSHRLAIESGRWARHTSPPMNKRKCVHCNVLEDEFHFVIECQIFIELRTKFLSKYYRKMSSMYKCIELLNTTNVQLLRNLSLYIYHAFKYQTDPLYGTQV